MWVASKYGWFSVVRKDGGYHVRARNPKDLSLLQNAVGGGFSKLRVHLTPEADYCSRVFIPQSKAKFLNDVMLVLAESVDYGNFKDAIADSKEQRDKLSAYHDVWSDMYGYQWRRQSAKFATVSKNY